MEAKAEKLHAGRIAGVVARNLVPVAGIAFLGWQAASLLVVYYVDTIAHLGAVVLGRPYSWEPKGDRGEALFGLCAMGVLLGAPVVFVAWNQLEPTVQLGVACLVQATLAIRLSLKDRRELDAEHEFSQRRRERARGELTNRLGMVFLRWIAVWLALAATPIGMVVAYLAATVYFELRPLKFFTQP